MIVLHDPDCPATNPGGGECVCDRTQWAVDDGSHRTVPAGAGDLRDAALRLADEWEHGLPDGEHLARMNAACAAVRALAGGPP